MVDPVAIVTATVTAADTDGAGVAALECSGLSRGRYFIDITPSGYTAQVEIIPGSPSVVHLYIPDACEYAISIVDVDGKDGIRPARVLWWYDIRTAWSPASLIKKASYDVAAGVYRVRAPSGSIEIVVDDEQYYTMQGAGKVACGPETHVVQVARMGAVVVQLVSSGRPEKWPLEYEPVLMTDGRNIHIGRVVFDRRGAVLWSPVFGECEVVVRNTADDNIIGRVRVRIEKGMETTVQLVIDK